MSKGYHSRSPDELKKYLENLNTKTKKRNWIQFLILADIIVLLFVFYMISKKITPDMEIQYKPSNKIQTEKYQIYFARSNEQEKDTTNYFIFIKNIYKEEIIFPEKNTRAIFILNHGIDDCIQKELFFTEKKIATNGKEFINISINNSELKKNDECKKFFEKQETRNWRNILADKKVKFIPEISLITENQIYKMKVE